MPRENRKRGKKNKKTSEVIPQEPEKPAQPEPTDGPSWIVSAPVEETNPEAPFGYVDADVKAYFRTVDIQIRDWQDVEPEIGDLSETDPNADRQLFFVAALREMTTKEKQLATDPDCSVILERMSYSMDDFVRRVFLDSLAGSYEILVKHRFASHVCQTLLTVIADTVSREARGIFPSVPESSDRGELRTATQLVADICDELLSTITSLIMDPFASHVVRALLLLLSPSSPSKDQAQSAIRSKKSASWKSKQGSMKSVFKSDKGKGKEISQKVNPPEFRQLGIIIVEEFKKTLSDNEIRALATSKVASPALHMLLELEADLGMSDEPGSLLDRVSVGTVTFSREDSDGTLEPSEYLTTLFRDPTSSHLLETIVSRSSDAAFSCLWVTYFKGRMARLAYHPVANFVVAKALDRATAEQLADTVTELSGIWGKIFESSRTGVLRAIIDRSANLGVLGDEVNEGLYSAFDLDSPEDRKFLVPCVLYMQSLQAYKSESGKSYPQEPKVQGAVLLQSLLRVPAPYNQPVIESLASLPVEDQLKIAHNSTSSWVLDAFLDSSTVPPKAKRQFILSFIGNYHLLLDDRIGSRVGEQCWAVADTYLKEKIARSLVQHEHTLAASYGRFFARNVNFYLLQRRPEEWRNLHSKPKVAQESRPTPPQPEATVPPSAASEKKNKKRKRRGEFRDEIDDVFDQTLGNKIKKGALASDVHSQSVTGTGGEKSLNTVLSAIRAAT